MSFWKTAEFLTLVEDKTGGNVKVPQSEYMSSGKYPVVDQGKDLVAGFVNDEASLWGGELPVVIFGDHTRCLKYVDFPFCIGADGVKVLSVRSGLDPKYFYHYLRSLNIQGVGYSRHFKFLKSYDIIYPASLDEQKRIAAILDKADALRAKRRKALELLDALAQAIFIEMFGDPVLNPKGWKTKRLGELGRVITGNTPSRSRADYYGGEIEWIKSENINSPSYYLTEAVERLSQAGKAVARVAPVGSVLVTCIAGSPECIGNAGLADREVAFNQQINALVPEGVESHFLYAHFLFGKKLVQRASTSGMKGMVSKSKFEEIEFMYPPHELQSEYSQKIRHIQKIRERCQQANAELDALFSSLQHRAFRGEL